MNTIMVGETNNFNPMTYILPGLFRLAFRAFPNLISSSDLTPKFSESSVQVIHFSTISFFK